MDDFDDGASDGSLGLREYVGFDNLGEHGFEEGTTGDNDIEAQNDELDHWTALELDQRWDHVMRLLQDKDTPCRWDDGCGDSGIDNFLESYRKDGLTVTGRDIRNPTVLHMLAKDFNKSNFSSLDGQTQQRIVKHLLDHWKRESKLRGRKDTQEDPMLTVAMQFDNVDFIKFIVRHFSDSMGDLLDASDVEGTNCLHHVFKLHLPSVLENYLKPKTGTKLALNARVTYAMVESFAKFARAETIAAQDKEGNTPLHYAMDYRICRMPVEEYINTVSRMIETGDSLLRKSAKAKQFNFLKDHESPFLYHLRTQREYLEILQKKQSSQSAPQALKPRPAISQKDTVNDRKMKPHITKDAVAPQKVKADAFGNSGDYDDSTEIGRLARDSSQSVVMQGKGKPGMLSSRLNDHIAGKRIEPKSSTPQTIRVRELSAMIKLRNTEFEAVPPAAPISADQVLSMRSTSHSDQSARNHHSVKAAYPAYSDATKLIQGTAKSPRSHEDREECQLAAEKIRNALKVHYIRTRPDIDAKELLYGQVASDKNLYFDARHLVGKSSSDIAELISMLSKPGGFEDTLSYIDLPYLGPDLVGSMVSSKPTQTAYSANQARQRDSISQSEVGAGRNSLVAVFDMLAKFGVRNILHLRVDDIYEKSPSHTDSAIERSIRGVDSIVPSFKRIEGQIGIENWDWIKLDLSIDVIRFSAPNVVKMNLYWSGNQAVLRGWASSEGIPRLYHDSKKKLKMVDLHASPGIESIDRMKKAIKQFQDDIKERTEGGVKVNVHRWMTDKTAGLQANGQLGRFGAGQARNPPDHEWVTSMENFRRALTLIHRQMPTEAHPRRIKVALIDDGVHLSSLDTYDKCVQVTGLSYRTPMVSPGGTIFEQPWHQSTRGHGTIMANMLVRINPWVSLYVIRIQDETDNSPSGGGAIKMDARSAAMAIEAAITRGVDIISMSWTIRHVVSGIAKVPNSHDDHAVEKLKKAIEKAVSKGIIMFCSASDDKKERSTDSLPFGLAPGYIFRIGAAGSDGQRDTATEDQGNISWFFPGNQVAEAINPRSVKGVEYHSGSSVATALAAGLASLVMYLPRMMQAHCEGVGGRDSEAVSKFASYAEKLRERDSMRRAFDNITDESHEDKKFLPVWHSFRQRAEQILESASLGAKAENPWGVLEGLVTELCSKVRV